MSSSLPPCFRRLGAPPKCHYRCYLLRHTLPFPRHSFLSLTPIRLRLASIVVHFYLPPDRHGLVCQQGSVETTKFCIVAAVDDVHGSHVFFAQSGNGVYVVPIGGVGGDGSGDVSLPQESRSTQR